MSFDRIAPFYRTLETIVFGNALQRARVRWLGAMDQPRRALVVGEGNGRFLYALLRSYPELQVECVDASARMLSLAQTKLRSEFPRARVQFIHCDILEWEPHGSFDLVVSHFFLDCFNAEQLERVVARLAQAAASEATWLLADFAIPKTRPGRMHAKIWLNAMYAFFRLAAGLQTRRLVDPTGLLRAEGFICRGSERTRMGMLKSERWSRAAVDATPAA